MVLPSDSNLNGKASFCFATHKFISHYPTALRTMAVLWYLLRSLLGVALLNWTCFADKIVYLERPAKQITALSEPVFNPYTLTANVGEQIHFVARFENQRPYRAEVMCDS